MDSCLGTNVNTCALALITLRAHFIAGRRQHCKLSNNVSLPNLLLCCKHLLTFLKFVSQICSARGNYLVYQSEIRGDLKHYFLTKLIIDMEGINVELPPPQDGKF